MSVKVEGNGAAAPQTVFTPTKFKMGEMKAFALRRNLKNDHFQMVDLQRKIFFFV